MREQWEALAAPLAVPAQVHPQRGFIPAAVAGIHCSVSLVAHRLLWGLACTLGLGEAWPRILPHCSKDQLQRHVDRLVQVLNPALIVLPAQVLPLFERRAGGEGAQDGRLSRAIIHHGVRTKEHRTFGILLAPFMQRLGAARLEHGLLQADELPLQAQVHVWALHLVLGFGLGAGVLFMFCIDQKVANSPNRLEPAPDRLQALGQKLVDFFGGHGALQLLGHAKAGTTRTEEVQQRQPSS